MRERFIGAMLIGNNIVNIGVSAFTTSVLVAVFGREGVIYATLVMSFVIVFSEVLPKTVAITPDTVFPALRAAGLHRRDGAGAPGARHRAPRQGLMLRPSGSASARTTPILSASEAARPGRPPP